MWLNRESPCFVLPFVGVLLLLQLPAPKEAQHGSTALFSSFIFQFGRAQSVTCQQYLYYTGEARGKKTCLEVFPYQQTSQCGLCSQKYVETSQVFLTAAFPVPSTTNFLQMEADSGWDDLPVPQIPAVPLPGSQAPCRTWDRVTITEVFTNPANVALGDKIEWEQGYWSKAGL